MTTPRPRRAARIAPRAGVSFAPPMINGLFVAAVELVRQPGGTLARPPREIGRPDDIRPVEQSRSCIAGADWRGRIANRWWVAVERDWIREETAARDLVAPGEDDDGPTALRECLERW